MLSDFKMIGWEVSFKYLTREGQLLSHCFIIYEIFYSKKKSCPWAWIQVPFPSVEKEQGRREKKNTSMLSRDLEVQLYLVFILHSPPTDIYARVLH